MLSVGFIGTGVMGQSMAGHILAAGHPLHVYTRTKAKAQPLVDKGASWHDTPGDLASACDCVITMVGYPSDVEQLYLGAGGIIEKSRDNALLIDMTTSSPSLAVRIHDEAFKRGLAALDAPVSGGDVGARDARLAIMVGGDRDAFDRALPVLELMGKNVVLQGAAGSGQFTKMANQIAIACNMMGICESLAYAKKAGLDPNTVLKSIGGGAAASWSLANMAPRMLAGDFSAGFYVKHFIKDMGIALESARELGIDLPGLWQSKKLYDTLAAQGGAELGTQALWKLYVS